MDEAISIHTNKNGVDIRGSEVEKKFLRVRKGTRRFRLEVEALRRMAGVEGIPALLVCSEAEQRIVISRIPGEDLTKATVVPDSCFVSLRRVVEDMLAHGVARHSIPPRDVIVRPDGAAGLVDFERITLRSWRWSPAWKIACRITRFHMMRLIVKHAPHLLSAQEQRQFDRQWKIHSAFRKLIQLRRRWRGKGQWEKKPAASA
jgi:predicted Ser/Thr protein kinase